MIFKNLLHRKGRTLLTIVGISIGVAAIVALGAISQGLRSGLSSMMEGSQADLVIMQADAFSFLLSSVDEGLTEEIAAWGEVDAVNGMLFTNALMDDQTFVMIFGHAPEGFSVEHYRVIEGQTLAEAHRVRGKPILLGRRLAESLDVQVGDTIRITGTAFRVVGIYETGDSFEDGAAVLPLVEAQTLALQPHQLSAIYVQLRDSGDVDVVISRLERRFADLRVSASAGFADQEQMVQILDVMAMTVAGLAVLIGGVGMTNTLFMSTFERTREIGVLRALGWKRRRVLLLILGESLILSLLGGGLGIGLGVLGTISLGGSQSVLSALGSQITPDLFVRAIVTVLVLGAVGGMYPAWWASRLVPLEALRYEGGAGDRIPQFLPGMVVRDLVRRRTRTMFTLLGIGISIAAIVAMGAFAEGMRSLMTEMWRLGQSDLFAIEIGVDSDFSAIDERVGAMISHWPEVEAVSGIFMTGATTDQSAILLVYGYHPREYAIQHFRIVEGHPLVSNHQVIVGVQAAEQMSLSVGDSLRLLSSNFRVVGIYESGIAFEEIGVVITLRDAQAILGKPNQVMYYGIKLHDPRQAEQVRDALAAAFPDVDFALTADLAEGISDFRVMNVMFNQLSFLTIFIGGVGMLNTMLMSVLERTREIGVLRALGWRRRQVLQLILKESLLLGGLGGVVGVFLGVGLALMTRFIPGTFGAIDLRFTPLIFVQALVVALVAGVLGGLYPAWRATRMQPVEALRYE